MNPDESTVQTSGMGLNDENWENNQRKPLKTKNNVNYISNSATCFH
jgi:hypothetical protein